MSESRYYDQRLETFLQAHPAADGWHVCDVDSSIMRELRALPAFISEAVAPDKIKKIKVVPCLDRDCTTVGSDFPGPATLKTEGWQGEIHFEWQGADMHLVRFYVLLDFQKPMLFLAVKSLEPLQHLWQALRRYNRKRLKNDLIEVPYGSDIMAPKVSWDEIFLPNDMISEIRSAAEAFFVAKEKYKKFGLAYRRGFLFTGSPGCGKTMMIKAMVANLGVPCVSYMPKGTTDETERIGDVFVRAANKAPSILVLEDLDKFKVDLSAVLNMLDGLATANGVLTIATANDPAKLDPALLLRPSRFDRVWSFPLPPFEQRLKFLTRKSGGAFSSQALEDAAKGSQGFSMAYVQEILATALTCAMNEKREPGDGDLLGSLDRLKKQVKTSQEAPREVGKHSDEVGFRSGQSV
jgi:hypothetical protein